MDVFKNQLVACHCYLLDVLRHPKKHPTTLLNRYLYHPHILQVFWVPNSWTFVRLLSHPSQKSCNSGSFCWQGEKHIIEIEWLWNANIICESRSCVPFPFPGEKNRSQAIFVSPPASIFGVRPVCSSDWWFRSSWNILNVIGADHPISVDWTFWETMK